MTPISVKHTAMQTNTHMLQKMFRALCLSDFWYAIITRFLSTLQNSYVQVFDS